MTAELVAFLHARLDEDEQIAREAQGHAVAFDASEEADRYLRHWRSARVLADVQAKRVILQGYIEAEARSEMTVALAALASAFRTVVRVLASVYADHVDYRSEWALDM